MSSFRNFPDRVSFPSPPGLVKDEKSYTSRPTSRITGICVCEDWGEVREGPRFCFFKQEPQEPWHTVKRNTEEVQEAGDGRGPDENMRSLSPH